MGLFILLSPSWPGVVARLKAQCADLVPDLLHEVRTALSSPRVLPRDMRAEHEPSGNKPSFPLFCLRLRRDEFVL